MNSKDTIENQHHFFSIILPVYNQAGHLEEAIQAYINVLSKVTFSYELLLVPNGCTDASEKICQKLCDKTNYVRMVKLKQSGWGRAVIAGIKEAKGNMICYTNLARTNANDLLLCLLYSHANNDNVIKANRKIRENWKRRLGSLLYNLECRMFFDMAFWDINGTPKIFPRHFSALMNLTKENDLIDLEFCVICRRQNFQMLEVPLISYKRFGGKSTTSYRSALNLYLGAYQLYKKNLVNYVSKT